MDITNGALSFEASLNNEKFIGAIEESKRRVQGFSQATAKEFSKVDDAFAITAENIRIQKDVIAQIESQIKQLNAQIDKTAPGMAQNDLRKQASQLTAELNGEKSALTMLEQQVKETEAAHVSFRTQIQQVREELIAMEVAGKRGTAEYDNLQKKAGELNTAYKDAQQQLNILANDEKGFQGLLSALTGVTGAFAAAQGAVGLFTGENENLNRIMLKVQSVMSLTIGLQQVSQTLNKDSYFSVVILTKAKELMAVAELKLATAFGVSTAAARVLMATLTLGLSAAITAAIVLISKFADKQQETRKAMKEFREATVDAAYKSLTQFERLRLSWNSLGNDLKAKNKFVKDNADAFKEMGIQVKTVADAQNVLVKNSEAVKTALLEQAKATAFLKLAEDKYKEIEEKRMEADAMPDKVKKYQTSGYMGQGGTEVYEVENKKKKKLMEEADQAQKELEDFLNKSVEASKIFTKTIAQVNNDNINALKAMTVGAIEEAIRLKKEAIKELSDPTEIQKVMKEIEKMEDQLDWMLGKKSKHTNELKPMARIESDNVVLSPKNLKAFNKEMNTLITNNEKLKMSETKFYDVTKLSIRQLRDYIDELKRKYQMIKNINAEKAKEIGEETGAAEDEIYNQRVAYLDGLSGIFDKIDSGLSGWISEAGTLVDALGTLNSASARQSDKIMANMTLFNLMISGFQTMFGNVGDNSEQLAELERAYANFQELLRSQMRLIDELVGTEKIERWGETIKQLDENIETILKKRRAWNIKDKKEQPLSDILGGTDLSDIDVYMKLLEQIQKTQENLDYARKTQKDNPNSARAVEIEQENLNQLQMLLDSYESRKDLMADFYSSILGTTSESISDSIRDGFENGLRTVEDFAENTKSILRRALMESFQAKYLDKQLQDWVNNFGKVAEDGTLTEQEIAAYQASLQAIVSNASVAFEEYEKMINGLNLSASSTTKSGALTGAIKGVSEETASIVAGQMNAIRINQAESLQAMRNQLIYLAEIASNTRTLKDIAGMIRNIGSTNSSRALGLNV